MNELIKLVIEYQKNKKDELFEKIINLLQDLINYMLSDINYYYRQDIYQEVLMKIHNAIFKFNIKIINDNDLKIIEAQFKKYINKIIVSVTKDFLKDKTNKFHHNLIQLNKINDDGIEVIETIKDESIVEESKFWIYSFDNKEVEFLNLFIDNNRILTEKEVVKKLGITQQAVHKRKNNIIKKQK